LRIREGETVVTVTDHLKMLQTYVNHWTHVKVPVVMQRS